MNEGQAVHAVRYAGMLVVAVVALGCETLVGPKQKSCGGELALVTYLSPRDTTLSAGALLRPSVYLSDVCRNRLASDLSFSSSDTAVAQILTSGAFWERAFVATRRAGTAKVDVRDGHYGNIGSISVTVIAK